MRRATCSVCGDNIIWYEHLGQRWYHADDLWRLGRGDYEKHVRLGCFNQAVPGESLWDGP